MCIFKYRLLQVFSHIKNGAINQPDLRNVQYICWGDFSTEFSMNFLRGHFPFIVVLLSWRFSVFLCCNANLISQTVGAVLITIFNLKVKSLLPVVLACINWVYCLPLIPEKWRSLFNLQTSLLFSTAFVSSCIWELCSYNTNSFGIKLVITQKDFPCDDGSLQARFLRAEKRMPILSWFLFSINYFQDFRNYKEWSVREQWENTVLRKQ